MTPASTNDLAAEAPAPSALARLAGSGWVRLAIVLLAAGFRLWALDLRPPHFDEGVNGMFTDQMQHTGFYRYDPSNYHGPLHFYILFLFKSLLGRNLWALRLPEALVGVLTVDWLFRFRRFFGPRICAWAALAMAVSPGFTFFHRYAIHETWLVFFMVLGNWGLFGLWRDGTRAALWATGMALAGMILTKETYVIHLAALNLAILGLWLLQSTLPRSLAGPPGSLMGRPTLQLWRPGDLGAVVGVGVFAIVFFYSGGGRHFGDLTGMVTTFLPWAHKAEVGEGHTKAFGYWFMLLLRQEPWALAGLVVCGRYIGWPHPAGWPLRLLALYAPAVFLAYSFIPYKTPWCIISIAWPFLFLTAAAITELPRLSRRAGSVIAAVAAIALLAWGGYLAWRLNFHRYADKNEDYVYVHTYEAVDEITGPLYDLARENAENYHLAGSVLCESVHPIPWLLGDFSRVGYYPRKSHSSPNYDAAFLLVDQLRVKDAEAKLRSPYYKQELTLRPSLKPIYLYLREAEFGHLMAGREVEFQPGVILDQ